MKKLKPNTELSSHQIQQQKLEMKLPPIKFSRVFSEIYPGEFKNKYQYLRDLGQGVQGMVVLVEDKRTGQKRAIKIMQFDSQNTLDEIKILQSLKHPNIITPLETCRDENYLYLVTEYCEGGTLFERIIRNKKISENIARDYVKQILSGLCYCHNKGVAH